MGDGLGIRESHQGRGYWRKSSGRRRGLAGVVGYLLIIALFLVVYMAFQQAWREHYERMEGEYKMWRHRQEIEKEAKTHRLPWEYIGEIPDEVDFR